MSSDFTPSPDQIDEALALRSQLDLILAALGKDRSNASSIAEINYLKASLGRRIVAHQEMPTAAKIPGISRQPSLLAKAAQTPALRPSTPATKTTDSNQTEPSIQSAPPENKLGLTFKHLLGKAGQPDHVSKGEEVLLLQILLGHLGLAVNPSGVFDLGTIQAVRNFQIKAKLPVTSLIESKSREALNTRLETWKTQLSSLLGKAPENITLEDLQNTRKRKTDPLPALPELKTERTSERIFGPNPPSINEAPEVELIHRVLKHLGLPTGKGTRYDAQTYASIRKFQANSRLKVTGLVDGLTLKALEALDQRQQAAASVRDNLLSQLRQHASSHTYPDSELKWQIVSLLLQSLITELESPLAAGQRQLEAIPELQSIERPLLHHDLGPIGQSGIISQGLEVERLQETLQTLGYEIKSQGHFDLQTLGEVRRYQQAQDIPATGIVDAATRTAINQILEQRYAEEQFYETLVESWRQFLNNAGLSVSELRWHWLLEICKKLMALLKLDPHNLEQLQALALPKRLSEDLSPTHAPALQVLLLQVLLTRAGLETELTGLFDAETTAHVRSYQTQHKLPMTGRVDARTREGLNQLIAIGLFDD